MGSADDEHGPLFETSGARGRTIYRSFAATLMVSIVMVWVYRIIFFPEAGTGLRLAWIGMLAAEVWFGFYWVLTQSVRWNCIYRRTFKHRLSLRYENELPGVDIFVCTADPVIEPPMMVISTILSVMAYDYPPEKLSVYLSDDGGSDLTFYATTEAALFAKRWLPYCRNYNVEPRSPAAYFRTASHPSVPKHAQDFSYMKELFEEMKNRIEKVTKLGNIPVEVRLEHEGFSQWDNFISRHDHDAIVQILINGRDPEAKDVEGRTLPTLVYLAREKRPQHFHNFKAGAMNALIRVSSIFSNGPIILNVDCDMYSNSSVSLRDALCFFMDEKQGHEIAFVQFPQNFDNLTKNEVYGASLRVMRQVDFHGLDGCGGPLYVGTGCFHRRATLLGKKFSKGSRNEWKVEDDHKMTESAHELEESSKLVASCTYENNTQWGNEMGLKYGVPVEDVITGLSIQCQGWKSVYYNPERMGFLGISSTTMEQNLVQNKRWSEGDLQIFLSKYSPIWYGLGRISPSLQMAYLIYCFWPLNSLPVLYYSTFPSLYLLTGMSLFPRVSSKWFLPFGYVIIATGVQSIAEYLFSGGTILGWWNDLRMWIYKRTSSYLFALTDTILGLMGFSNVSFIVSTKVVDEDVAERYEKEMIEFGVASPMFTILASLAMLNLFCFIGLMVKGVVTGTGIVVELYSGHMIIQILLCAFLTVINLPLYEAMFLRKDKGRMPTSVTIKAVSLALFASTSFSLLY